MRRRGLERVESELAPGFSVAAVERVLRKVDATGLCWEWTACRNREGYGRVTVEGVSQYAHRLLWLMFVGEIPEGLDLDHLCRNRGCVNPDHLQPVTRSVNVARGASRALVANARAARSRRRAA